MEGLGPINDKESQRGFLVHSALAMTPSGVPLGLLYQHSWARDPDTFGKSKDRQKRNLADKESRKWLDALRGVEAVLPENQSALLIQDREADVFAFFAAPRRAGIDLLIRAVQPRRVEIQSVEIQSSDNSSGNSSTLLQAVAHAPVVASKVVASKVVAIHARPDRESRQAQLTIRLLRADILAPKTLSKEELFSASIPSSVPLWVVSASEENPSPGVKEPIRWVLLTTLEEVNEEIAEQLVDYYALRWRIERFHYVLKSGCGYERLQVDSFIALEKALSLYSVIAWRLLYLTYLARESPQSASPSSPNEILSAVEKEVLERYTGKAIGSIEEAVLAIAKIGGFVWVPSAPTPEVKSLWLGFRKLQDVVAGYLLARQSTTIKN